MLVRLREWADAGARSRPPYTARVPLLRLFPTLVYTARLNRRGVRVLDERLRRECLQLRRDDAAGRRWSNESYPGGYTSYSSASRMHEQSPTFAALAREIDRHVRVFARALDFDLAGRPLAMTDCWVNIMPRGTAHSLHLHPLSTVSGTYYVSTPPRASGMKLEDPRLDRMMAAPPRRQRRQAGGNVTSSWVVLPAEAGMLVLFESWLRHEVPPNAARGERISISFNYNWF